MDALIAFATLFVLASLRYLPVVVLPGLSPLAWAPMPVRMVMLVALSWLTVLSLPAESAAVPALWSIGMVLAVGAELLLGLTFGLAFLLPNAALHSAGWLVDMQAGLGAATLFNPANDSGAESLLGHALMLAATVLFFTLDLHLLLFKAMAASVRSLPLGQGGMHLSVEGFLQLLGSSFLMGVMVVAPVVLGLFCVDLGVGYASRSMPQANMYFLALPVKVAIALGLLALTLAYAPVVMGRLFQSALQQTPAVMGAP